MGDATGWLVLLGPEQLGLADAAGVVQPWLAHPLVVPFQQIDTTQTIGAGAAHCIGLRRWLGCLGDMEKELVQRRLGYSQAVAAMLNLLLISAARMSPRPTSNREDHLDSLALEIVDERFTQSVTLRDVADALHVTSGHLTEVVRLRTGRPLGEWILQRRMIQARLLLGETETPVVEVASQSGFTTVGHFGRRFRRLHGMSPSEWRSSVAGQA